MEINPLRIRERKIIEGSMVSGTMLIRLIAKRSLPVLKHLSLDALVAGTAK